ncbi:MAG: aspartate aminotransferase family protein [Oscillospiraceae bacterium]|nr:aspartate aminotransferase family protein [Oscillospiraceae bacterium]MDD3832916.1 aspartate aminotransferase family protein [Oscillospiraceae bacterium]
MIFEDVLNAEHSSIMPTYGRFDVAVASGKGATATDINGKEYIDFGSGIGVNSLGYADPDWVAAVQIQASTLAHISNLYYNEVQVSFADRLCKLSGMARVFLGNSGAEANECAIKLARKYSHDKYGLGRHKIICLKNSFHGRTLTTLSATGQDSFHQYFFPFTQGFEFAQAGDIGDLKDKMGNDVCAVMLECIQGEGGVVPLSPEYLSAVRALCDAKDVLLIIDEVQTGAGRTGRFFAFQHSDITPDIVTMAKGLGGGLPIGACLCSEKLAGVMSPGTHGSTFGGNMVVCAGANVVLQKLSADGFMDEVAKKGEYIRQRLLSMPNVKEVRGLGMMLGIVTRQGDAKEIAKDCIQNGLLILTAKTLLRLLPPLTISPAEIDKGLSILEIALKGAIKT